MKYTTTSHIEYLGLHLKFVIGSFNAPAHIKDSEIIDTPDVIYECFIYNMPVFLMYDGNIYHTITEITQREYLTLKTFFIDNESHYDYKADLMVAAIL